ncbi:chemotaxis protein CheW [Candidatus Riflebacteria bacterium]
MAFQDMAKNGAKTEGRRKEDMLMHVEDTLEFCTFWVGGYLYGVEILDVREINTETKLTRIFHAPDEVMGYVNLRGQIFLILDLGLLMGYEKKTEILSSNRLVIFKPEVGESFGVLVDRIDDILDVPVSQFELTNPSSGTGNGLKHSDVGIIKGVCKLGGKLLVVLDSRKIYASVESKLNLLNPAVA